MTSEGSAYSRFRRALRTGNLNLVRAAALELPTVQLDDALEVCLLMAEKHDRSYDRAATKWLARLVIEKPAVGLEELRLGMTALEALGENPIGAKQVLGELCERHGLYGVKSRLA
jgi:hypothetical protein